MEFDTGFWSALMLIIGINLVLSGDNAVVIALATHRLSKQEREKGIFWGTFGAVALRIILTTVAAALLKIPYVQAVGGIFLIYIAVKLLRGEDESEQIEAAGNLRDAIKTIILADLLMSLDNVLAVAGASEGNIILLVLGLISSVPIVILGSSILSHLMKRYPWIISLGAGLLGYTAGEMILNEFSFLTQVHVFEYIIPGALAIGVIVWGNWLKSRRRAVLVTKMQKRDNC